MVREIIATCIVLSILSACTKNNPATPVEDNQGDSWETKVSMPTARAILSGAVLDGEIFLMGGMIDRTTNSDVVEVYNPEADNWITKHKMPQKILGAACTTFEGKIYVFGGRVGDMYTGTSLKSTYVYDPNSDSWTRKSDMLTARAYLTASLVNGKIYLIGGATTGYEGLKSVQMYDPSSDSWFSKEDLPRGRVLHTANVYNGKIYVLGGGVASNNATGTAYRDFDVYDPVNDSWESEEDLSKARLGHASGMIDENLYICGGITTNDERLYDLKEYNFITHSWTSRASMPFPRRWFVLCVYNKKLYLFGGIAGIAGAETLNSISIYTPPN